MSEKQAWYVAMAVSIIVVYMIFKCPHASAQEAEMQLEVSRDGERREHHIRDLEGRPLAIMECIYQGQAIAYKWVAENLRGMWQVDRYSCGPPKRKI